MKNKILESIRQIMDVKNQSIQVDLPKNFKAKRVEVIIMPSNEPIEIPEWHKAIIDERMKAFRANPNTGVDADIVFKELEKEFK